MIIIFSLLLFFGHCINVLCALLTLPFHGFVTLVTPFNSCDIFKKDKNNFLHTLLWPVRLLIFVISIGLFFAFNILLTVLWSGEYRSKGYILLFIFGFLAQIYGMFWHDKYFWEWSSDDGEGFVAGFYCFMDLWNLLMLGVIVCTVVRIPKTLTDIFTDNRIFCERFSITFTYHAFSGIIDLFLIVTLPISFLAIWRLPKFIHELNELGYDTPDHADRKAERQLERRAIIFLNLCNSIVDLIPILLTPLLFALIYRAILCHKECKRKYGNNGNLSYFNSIFIENWNEVRFVVLKHELNFLIDLPCIAVGLLSLMFIWRIPIIIKDFRTFKETGQRRAIAIMHFILSPLDILAAICFVICIITLWRANQTLTELKEYIEKFKEARRVPEVMFGIYHPIIFKQFFALFFDTPFIMCSFFCLLFPTRTIFFKRALSKCETNMERRKTVLLHMVYCLLDIPALLCVVWLFLTIYRFKDLLLPLRECKKYKEDNTYRDKMENWDPFYDRNIAVYHLIIFREFYHFMLDIPFLIISLFLILGFWRSCALKKVLKDPETKGQRRKKIAAEGLLLALDLPCLVFLIILTVSWRVQIVYTLLKERQPTDPWHRIIIDQFYEYILDVIFIAISPLCLWRFPFMFRQCFYGDAKGANQRRRIVSTTILYTLIDIPCAIILLLILVSVWRAFCTYIDYKKRDKEKKIQYFIFDQFVELLLDLPVILIFLPITIATIIRVYSLVQHLRQSEGNWERRKILFFEFCKIIPDLLLTFLFIICFICLWRFPTLKFLLKKNYSENSFKNDNWKAQINLDLYNDFEWGLRALILRFHFIIILDISFFILLILKLVLIKRNIEIFKRMSYAKKRFTQQRKLNFENPELLNNVIKKYYYRLTGRKCPNEETMEKQQDHQVQQVKQVQQVQQTGQGQGQGQEIKKGMDIPLNEILLNEESNDELEKEKVDSESSSDSSSSSSSEAEEEEENILDFQIHAKREKNSVLSNFFIELEKDHQTKINLINETYKSVTIEEKIDFFIQNILSRLYKNGQESLNQMEIIQFYFLLKRIDQLIPNDNPLFKDGLPATMTIEQLNQDLLMRYNQNVELFIQIAYTLGYNENLVPDERVIDMLESGRMKSNVSEDIEKIKELLFQHPMNETSINPIFKASIPLLLNLPTFWQSNLYLADIYPEEALDLQQQEITKENLHSFLRLLFLGKTRIFFELLRTFGFYYFNEFKGIPSNEQILSQDNIHHNQPKEQYIENWKKHLHCDNFKKFKKKNAVLLKNKFGLIFESKKLFKNFQLNVLNEIQRRNLLLTPLEVILTHFAQINSHFVFYLFNKGNLSLKADITSGDSLESDGYQALNDPNDNENNNHNRNNNNNNNNTRDDIFPEDDFTTMIKNLGGTYLRKAEYKEAFNENLELEEFWRLSKEQKRIIEEIYSRYEIDGEIEIKKFVCSFVWIFRHHNFDLKTFQRKITNKHDLDKLITYFGYSSENYEIIPWDDRKEIVNQYSQEAQGAREGEQIQLALYHISKAIFMCTMNVEETEDLIELVKLRIQYLISGEYYKDALVDMEFLERIGLPNKEIAKFILFNKAICLKNMDENLKTISTLKTVYKHSPTKEEDQRVKEGVKEIKEIIKEKLIRRDTNAGYDALNEIDTPLAPLSFTFFYPIILQELMWSLFLFWHVLLIPIKIFGLLSHPLWKYLTARFAQKKLYGKGKITFSFLLASNYFSYSQNRNVYFYTLVKKNKNNLNFLGLHKFLAINILVGTVLLFNDLALIPAFVNYLYGLVFSFFAPTWYKNYLNSIPGRKMYHSVIQLLFLVEAISFFGIIALQGLYIYLIIALFDNKGLISILSILTIIVLIASWSHTYYININKNPMYRPYLALNTILSLVYEKIHGSLNGRGKLGLYYNRILGYITWILWSCNECCGTLLLLPFYFAWAGWPLILTIYFGKTFNDNILWCLFASIPLTIALLVKGFKVMKDNVSHNPQCREPAPKYNKLIHRLELYFRFKIAQKKYLHISSHDTCLHFSSIDQYPNLFCNTDDNHYTKIYYRKTIERANKTVISNKIQPKISETRNLYSKINQEMHFGHDFEISYNNYNYKEKKFHK
ncbi:lish domain-containing protein fopnl [Anaeramoeba flamelloides]|uniref:Lish domain-containing protein fopnl n=1 Tax=Anaeramoeba flamelloides TaxID=1746091 RepID=A0AAV7ZFK3_9EUKA|nr:lish domain-containing protein fopnl [Anaeramoeba flamelloides]